MGRFEFGDIVLSRDNQKHLYRVTKEYNKVEDYYMFQRINSYNVFYFQQPEPETFGAAEYFIAQPLKRMILFEKK